MRDRVFEYELSCGLQLEQVLNPRDNSFIRASGISECRRKIAYRLLGYPAVPISSHLLSVFDLGHGLHYKIQKRISENGWVDAEPFINSYNQLEWNGNCEIPLINEEYKIAGHCDGLSKPLRRVTKSIGGVSIETIEVTDEDDPDGRRYIIDIKSITAREKLKVECDPKTGCVRNHEVIPSSFEKLSAPKDDHIGQVSLYSWMTTQSNTKIGRLDGPLPTLPGIMIIYVAKDLDPAYYSKYPEEYTSPKRLLNSPYKVFTQDVNPKVVDILLRKAKAIWKSLDEDTLPPRDYHYKPERPDYHCTDCPFRKECYKSEGYFEDEDLSTPPLVKYRTSLINPELITLG